MASNKLSNSSSYRSGYHHNSEFWQQLARDFSFEGIDEAQLRLYTEQWVTCASELLGPPPCRTKKKTKL